MNRQRPDVRTWCLVIVALLVAACSQTTTAPMPQPVVTPAPTKAPARATEEPADEPVAGTGVITFGRSYNTNSLRIIGPAKSFKASSKLIAWSAELTEAAGATTLELIIASINKAGAQQTVLKQDTDIADPTSDLIASKFDLAGVLDRKPGTYVMRYIRAGDVLAEGEFTLVK